MIEVLAHYSLVHYSILVRITLFETRIEPPCRVKWIYHIFLCNNFVVANAVFEQKDYLTFTPGLIGTYKLVVFLHPKRAILFQQIFKSGICSIFVQVATVNIPLPAHVAV